MRRPARPPANEQRAMTDYMKRYADRSLQVIPHLATRSEDHRAVANLARLPIDELSKSVSALASLYEKVTTPPHARTPPRGLVFLAIRDMPLPEQAYVYIEGILREASTTQLRQLTDQVKSLSGNGDAAGITRQQVAASHTTSTTRRSGPQPNRHEPAPIRDTSRTVRGQAR